ncbi:MAG: peptidase, partial [Candidatus Eisenbacteria bacterium]
MRRPVVRFLLAGLVAGLLPAAAHAATITIVNNDGVGEGVNSTTPVSSVGGNPGTTLGAQRLFVFQTAASIWGSLLPSTVEIRVNAQFNPQTCDATSAVLGSAGAATNVSGFAGAEVANTWYPIALANRMAGVDLAVGTNDINAQFNS